MYLKTISSFLNYSQRKAFVSSLFVLNKRCYQDIKIGNVTKSIVPPSNPHLVPTGYLSKNLPQSILQHLQWIMKKDILGQDIFLIGIPGPFRGRILLQYLELMQREIEYVVLSRDTTENDLKQRREISNGTAHYVDQSAVRAAIEGRFLILDGIEKVERNVLPVLNNLLENREMQLEDGRFLIAPERYDKLLQEHSKETLDSWKLVRVSENFRVAALGLPIPLFKGNPLDPPFRSRFQARNIQPNFDEHLVQLSKLSNKLPEKLLKNFISACYAFQSNESESLGMPKFPIESLRIAVKILSEIPSLPLEHVFKWIYPYNLILSKEGQKSVLDTLKMFSVTPENIQADFDVKYVGKNNSMQCMYSLELNMKGKKIVCNVLGHENNTGLASSNFVPNPYHNNILADMLKTHSQHDFCLVGNKGSGKSILAKKFASLLNYPVEMIMLYADMTARELLQQRITDEEGNTVWRSSQLVNAAKEGKLLVLDGLHRLHSSTLSVLQRLLHDREIQLYDGTRLLSHDRYEAIKQKNGFSDTEMENKFIQKIHPAFRILALAETPKIQISKDQWITPELMSMFLFHSLRPLSLEEEKFVVKQVVGKENHKMNTILDFTQKLRNSKDEALKSVSVSFSTRQLVRLAQKLSAFPDVSVYSLITQACLLKFLPQLTKQAIENILESCNIKDFKSTERMKDIYTKNDNLFIGTTSIPIYTPGDSKVKVPNILFYNNQEHLEVMEAMLQDFMLGEHLLLVGNQGVGKNKITDRFLQLLNRPREYIQLHRDTTVQSLTQQPTVVDGKIVYEDSPLLIAVQKGHVLIVDEADKAPTHVTSILKALVESGEMVLSDGRCIVHHTDTKSKKDPQKVIMHPDFRMIVLANRPGFPFLGNDFFATLGDIFSCHAVDNPSLESEITMLRQYAPTVPENTLKKLTKLFGELRTMSDEGLISYPYSTREVVNVTKHVGRFPNERVSDVLKNVFDFDSYNFDLKDTIHNLFRKYGIPVENGIVTVNTASYYKLPKLSLKSQWNLEDYDVWVSKMSNLVLEDQHKLPVEVKKLDVSDTRGNVFSEQISSCKVPLKSNDIPLSIDATQLQNHNIFYVATANPVSLHTVNQDKLEIISVKLADYFPTIRSGFKPAVNISSLSLKEEAVLFNEISTNQFFVIEPSKGVVKSMNVVSLFKDAISRITNAVYSRSIPKPVYSYVDFPSRKKVLIFKLNSNKISLWDFGLDKLYHLDVPQNLKQVSVFSENGILLIMEQNNFVADITNPLRWEVKKVNFDDNSLNCTSLKLDTFSSDMSFDNLPAIAKTKTKTVLLNPEDYVSIISGSLLRDQEVKVYGFPRNNYVSVEDKSSCLLPNSAQVVRLLRTRDIAENIRNKFKDENLSFIELINFKDLTYGYIGVDLPHILSSFASWLANTSENYLQMSPCANEELLTIDLNGLVQKWQINKQLLETSFLEWQNNIGLKNNEERLNIEYVNSNQAEAPKHGKIDPTGNPHVGGNTWAGGTGGRDTAGLGGKGGPYRLDAGHSVYQLSDSEKEAVPLEVREAARKMALKAFKEKLREIDMSEYDAELYGNFLTNVKKEINVLRVILDGLQAKSKERRWMRHQTSGELDDTKLIEGITGEKSIYKKRSEQEPEMGSPQEKPKLLRLVVDVSGSMYRFNGHDNRLQRELESIVLVMEAFDGYQDKFKYEIVGHSGEDLNIEFSQFNSAPKNDKEKLDIIKKMFAHSQFCMSGDNTLPATEHAIKTIINEDADEYFVIVLSDANFDRYGISPTSFSNLLVSNSKVNAFAIFIGSLGNQATVLLKNMPAGRAFVCFDSVNLTQILQRIFTSALLRD